MAGNKLRNMLLWFTVAAVLVVTFLDGLAVADLWVDYGHCIIVAIMVVYSTIQSVQRYGWKGFLVFLAIVFVVGNIYENGSIATGFPFGNYFYSDDYGPKLIYTPLIINIAYYAMIFIVWNLTDVILDHYDNQTKGIYLFAKPFIAAFIMVMWDMVMDPGFSTLGGMWTWEEGGAYFGVPLSNFYGWYLCVFTMFLLFALYTAKYQEQKISEIVYSKTFWLQNILMYASWVLLFTLRGITTASTVMLTDAVGQVWYAKQLCQTGGLIGLFSIVPIGALVFCKVFLLKRLPNKE